MKFFLCAVALAFTPVAHAETWQCTNSQTGSKYIVSQVVPGDICKLVSSTASPHGNEPDLSRPGSQLRSVGASSCNRATAAQIKTSMQEFASGDMEGDHLAIHWKYAIEKRSKSEQLKMVTTFADMDACLRGSAFEIMFYRKGKLMGIASPTTGVRLVN